MVPSSLVAAAEVVEGGGSYGGLGGGIVWLDTTTPASVMAKIIHLAIKSNKMPSSLECQLLTCGKESCVCLL